MDNTARSPFPTDSDASSDDAVNTSNARVHFGPFSSPEKRLVALVDPVQISSQCLNMSDSTKTKEHETTLRRSPRLSQLDTGSAVEEQELLEETGSEQEEEDVALVQTQLFSNTAWEEEPYRELVLLRDDEPSSAIASRIMRAHDNPSPPPKALRPSSTPRRISRSLVFPSNSSSEDSSDAALETLPTPRASERALVSSPSNNTPSQSTSSSNHNSSPTMLCSTNTPIVRPPPSSVDDLISFDRSVIMNQPNDLQIQSPSPRRVPHQAQTIDDLLFLSPPSTVPEHTAQTNVELEESSKLTCSTLLVDLGQSPGHEPNVPVPSSGTHVPLLGPELAELCSQRLDTEPKFTGMKADESNELSMTSEVQTTPTNSLLIPGTNSSLRRSPRLSAIPPPPPSVINDSTLEKTPKGRPTNSAESSRKRRRDSSKTPRMSLTPKKSEWIMKSDSSESEAEHLKSPTRKPRRDRKRVKKSEEVSNGLEKLQLVDSLSPTSAEILTTLVTSDQNPSDMLGGSDLPAPSTPLSKPQMLATENSAPGSTSYPPISSSVQRPPPGIFGASIHTPRGHASANSMFNSPAKFTLTSLGNNPNRTPARRVPIPRATDNSQVMESTMYLRQPQTSTSTLPIQASNAPSRSPAKRVPVFTELLSKGSGTQQKNISASRSMKVPSRSRSTSVEPSLPTSSTTFSRPLVNNGISRHKANSLPRQNMAPPKETSAPSGSSKLTVSTVTSRIPRPGIASKPRVSRLPTPASRIVKVNKSKAVHTSSAATSNPVSSSQSSSSSGSDDIINGQSPALSPSGAKPPRTLSQVKRRKALEKAAPAPRQLIKARQVIPGMFGGPVKSELINNPDKGLANQSSASPMRPIPQQRQLMPREVVKGTLQDFTLQSSSSKALEAISEARAKERAAQEQAALEKAEQERVVREAAEQERAAREKAELERAAQEKAEQEKEAQAKATEEKVEMEAHAQQLIVSGPSLEEFTFECPLPEQKDEKMDVDEQLPPKVQPSSDDIANEASGSRRSTRSRRSVQSTDILGAASAIPLPGSTTSRRVQSTGSRPRNSITPNLVFHTNGLALKTLTNNNTTRNQRYHAQLEMNVIRRSGNRPESPTMKLQTILEKQKGEQDKMRAERARRRRGESIGNESGDVQTVEQPDGQNAKHRRGPGDEEDYETPVRPSTRKGVKWDRDLGVTVFLDEIEVQPDKRKEASQVVIPSKSCLAIRAPLDGLGNMLNAEAPLNLIPETVVVTKYVYDNDIEAQVVEPPKTRSKAKKR